MYAFEEIELDQPAFQAAVDARVAYRPVYVKIKLIYGCNLKCEMCNHWREVREPPLTAERLRAILVELAELGCRKIHFSGGEPLLRPQVPEWIALASELGMRVTLTTNGTLIDKTLAKRLVEAGLRGVNVSLDSPQRKVHDHVRGVPGAWKETLGALKFFGRYAHKGKLTVRVNTVVSRTTYPTLAGMPDLIHTTGANGWNLIPVDDHCDERLSLRRGDIAAYNAQIAPVLAERALAHGLFRVEEEAYPFGRTLDETQRARRGEYALGWYTRHPCFAPWTHSLIDFNGFVYICCMTREQIAPLGDLKHSTFRAVWEGPAYAQIRQMMHPPALAPCRRCDDFLEENRRLLALAEPGVVASGQ